MSHPRATIVVALRVLASSPPDTDRSYARQALGIATREIGDVPAAVRHLRQALVDAASVGAARHADVAASLAVTLVVAGRGDEALQTLDAALGEVTGVDAARVRVRRGSLLGELGRPEEAARELRAAARVLQRHGDTVWETGAQLNLAMASIEVGDTGRADRSLVRVEELRHGVGGTFEAALSSQYRGLVAVLEGRTPDALRHYDVAAAAYADSGTQSAELLESRAMALLAAGMPVDALASAEQAVEILRGPGSSPAYRARALVRASDAALAAGRPELSRRYSTDALRLFRRQGRERGVTLARLSVARARFVDGHGDRRLLGELSDIADDAGRRRMPEAIEANLLAGEVALVLGARDAATRHLSRARRARTTPSDLHKVLGWRAAALSARASGRTSAVFAACDAGLSALESHQGTLGAIETRAAASVHGFPLAVIALRTAVESKDPKRMLQWVERWRSTTLRLPAVRLPDDRGLVSALAQLRLARLRLDEAAAANEPVDRLEREIASLEASVRDRTHRTSAADAGRRIEVDTALAALAHTTLVEIFVVDGVVHVLVARAGTVRHHVAGDLAVAIKAAEFARFSLRRMTSRTAGDRARTALPLQAQALQNAVLGTADLGDGPIVVVPPAALASAPWGILPTLRARSVHVAASAMSWWSAGRAVPPENAGIALVSGPGLAQAEDEIDRLAARYPGAHVLRAGAATADAVLDALDGAALAHVAAHGTFRADNPLFSALHLDDGPLTVYDLQRLRRAPHRLVLSCCDSGTVSAAGADEALGIASALVPLGMAGMIAAVVPVSDIAAVPFAEQLHGHLQAGASMAEALRDARMDADRPASYAIAHSFLAFGAG